MADKGGGAGGSATAAYETKAPKPPLRLAKDDTKPLLRDPILRLDPVETEQAVLRLPPFLPLPKEPDEMDRGPSPTQRASTGSHNMSCR